MTFTSVLLFCFVCIVILGEMRCLGRMEWRDYEDEAARSWSQIMRWREAGQGQANSDYDYDYKTGLNQCRSDFVSYKLCPDYRSMVSCVEKLGDLNLPLILRRNLKLTIIQYTNLRDACPGITDQGQCVEGEVQKCNANKGDVNYAKSCKLLEEAISCMGAILSKCYDNYAVSQKAWTEQIKKSYCDLSGAERKCLDDVGVCSAMVTYPRRGSSRYSSCNMTDSSRDCLSKVISDPVCNSTYGVRSWMEQQLKLVDNMEDICSVASGPCSKDAMEKCTNVAYGTSPCQASKFEEAKKCLEGIDPNCTTDYQRRVFLSQMFFVEKYCNSVM